MTLRVGGRARLPGVRSERTLVVAATRAEAAFVPRELPVVVTGLGKTAAAVATVRALHGLDPAQTQVVNIGTAGALHDGLEGIHLPGTALNHDMNADAIRALGYDPQERLSIEDGDRTVLASGDVFVTDPVVRARLAEQADLVDMEGYAVAYACRRLGVTVRLVKHVSDNADEGALDWPDLVRDSARALGAWLEEQLDSSHHVRNGW
jgi:adenosylhomocysteine nucleosidase